MQKARILARNGLRLRDSPRDGETLAIMRHNDQVEILGRETWLRVRHKGLEGFALADHVEPVEKDAEGSRFEIVPYPPSDVFRGEPLQISTEFEEAVQRIEHNARARDITIWVTSSFREPYRYLADSIVVPAKLSNHHVGHAFDMNIIHGGEFYNSTRLSDPLQLPSDVRLFLNSISVELGYRWGGNFDPPDPVHIDDGINVRNPALFRRIFEK